MENERDDIWKEVVLADERARQGRVDRLNVLNIGISTDPIPIPALAAEYFEEARLCWYTGAYIAAILMAQLSFEEFFRSHYRAVFGVGGKLKSGSTIDRAQFFDLLNEANQDGTITQEEFCRLDGIRKARNAYVHTKDSVPSDVAKPNFFDQMLKVSAPHLVGISAENEARTSIQTLVELFAPICARSFGLTHTSASTEA
ncbi:MAG: hypothetical protein LAN64_14155 [Acidobacteriia bacterium]|nr:hypothetical protein [Terriglobia bacterium]